MTDEKKPWCCWPECKADAVFQIIGGSNHPDDNTQACTDHVGALLGTPQGIAKNNTYWDVSLIEPS